MKKLIGDNQRNLRNFRANAPDSPKIPVWEQALVENENTKHLVDAELSRLYAFMGFFSRLREDLDIIHEAINTGRAGSDQDIEALRRHEPEKVTDLLARRRPEKQLGIKDLVIWKTRQFETEMEALDQEALLSRIVDRFLDEPAGHPLWLQYMVVHFSGMRYQSAHGSWGDPKDILISLKIKSIHDKLKNDPEPVLRAEAALEAGILSALPDADLPENQRIIAGLESENLFVQRRTLQDVWVEKKKIAIESMDQEQVLKDLEEMSDQMPPWMWKEIVSRTDLRLAHAGAGWESLSEDDKEGYYDRINAEFRDILVKWKSKNLTMWREEHARANRLIVTRAVCNEVAEHIQHLRGISPPGGLTAKPLWFRNTEKSGTSGVGGGRPFFRKARAYSDFETGASIFWLRWVRGRPNIWRITRPLELVGGEDLLPAGMILSRSERLLRDQKNALKDGGIAPWVHDMKDNAYRRRRLTASLEPKPNNPNRTRWVVASEPEEQYLRWMHEATIVESGDTAEGRVVLTFETALPYEDPRRSTIGVFKRFAGHLIYNVNADVMNGTFIGYMPPASPPLEDLKAMLDWRKIVPGKEIAQEKIDHYWQEVEKSLAVPPGTIEAIGTDEPSVEKAATWVESAPKFESRQEEFTLCYEISPDPQRAGRFKDAVAKPRVELARGWHFEVTKEGAVKVGNDTYYEVLRCEQEPKAAGRFVRAAECLELPEPRSLPFRIPELTNLRSMRSLNQKNKPVMLPSGIKLITDTMVRVSRVHHKVSDAGTGEGRIDTDGPIDYYLIVECPSRPVAEGLFIQDGMVEPVSEEAYEAGKLTGAVGLDPEKPVKAKVIPEDNGENAALFEKKAETRTVAESFDRVWQVLPKDAEIEIGAIEITRGGKVFYPVTRYRKDTGLEGFYIRRKEITILPSS